MTEPKFAPGNHIRVRRTGAFGLPAIFTATVLEDRGHLGYRIRMDDTGKTWLLTATDIVRKHGNEQTIELIEETP